MPIRTVVGGVFASVLVIAPTPLPQGTYQVALSARDARNAGAEGRDAVWDQGRWTLTFAGRRWTLRQAGGVYGNALDRGTLARTRDGAAFTLRSANGFAHNEDIGTLRWQADGDLLRFSPVVLARNTDLAAVLSARPWKRVR